MGGRMIKHILFPITYNCNLDCYFCKEKNKVLDRSAQDSVETIINGHAGKVPWIFITGGEPFLSEDLIWACDTLRAAGFKVGVTTNGTINKPEIADHVDRIGISIDGDKEFHDSARGDGVYDKAINFLKSIHGKCETIVMSVALADNKEALLKLKPILEEINPTYWQVQTDIHNPNVPIPV